MCGQRHSFRAAVRLLFDKVAELGSARQACAFLLAQDIRLGVRSYRGPDKGTLTWRLPRLSTIYDMLRHPIYAGYLLTHIAFLIANPGPWNAAVVVLGDSALIVRALIEERVLGGDVAYQAYCRRVGWHLVPGVF